MQKKIRATLFWIRKLLSSAVCRSWLRVWPYPIAKVQCVDSMFCTTKIAWWKNNWKATLALEKHSIDISYKVNFKKLVWSSYWCSDNAVIFGARGTRFKSRDGQIWHSVANSYTRPQDIFPKEAMLLADAMTQRWAVTCFGVIRVHQVLYN